MAVLVAVSMLSGCYATFDIPLSEAPHLAYNSPVHEVRTTTGDTRTFDASSKVTMIPRAGMPATLEAPMTSEIKDGMLIMQGRSNPVPLVIPLTWVYTLRVRQLSSNGTAGAVLGIVAGGATVITLFALLLASFKA